MRSSSMGLFYLPRRPTPRVKSWTLRGGTGHSDAGCGTPTGDARVTLEGSKTLTPGRTPPAGDGTVVKGAAVEVVIERPAATAGNTAAGCLSCPSGAGEVLENSAVAVDNAAAA
mmetsp:Transcript_62647/g.141242  ORF Transcript_62647/g.141242 Transcript_62647/m.141242 type:complete len:114 (+) Transcript_62647:1-342(+)